MVVDRLVQVSSKSQYTDRSSNYKQAYKQYRYLDAFTADVVILDDLQLDCYLLVTGRALLILGGGYNYGMVEVLNMSNDRFQQELIPILSNKRKGFTDIFDLGDYLVHCGFNIEYRLPTGEYNRHLVI